LPQNSFDRCRRAVGRSASITAEDGNRMMIANRAPVSNGDVWRENGLAITANTRYYLPTWVSSMTPGSPANLSFSINGAHIGALRAASRTAWQQFDTTGNPGSATSADIVLVNLNTAASGNGFAPDNLAFDTLPPAPVPEPGSIALVGLGLAGAALARRRKQRA
jgi:hypothetical protein